MGNGADPAELTRYRGTFLNGKKPSDVPFMGKLVLVVELKHHLDVPGTVEARIAEANQTARDLVCLYPNYANAYVIVAKLAAFEVDAHVRGPGTNSDVRGSRTLKDIQANLDRASGLDRDLANVVRLANLNLPPDIIMDLDENPSKPDLLQRLTAFATSTVMPLSQSLLVSEALSSVATDRTLLHAIRRGVGEKRINKLLADIRSGSQKPQDQIQGYVAISEAFLGIDDFLLAEKWAQAARKMINGAPAPDPGLADRLKAVEAELTNRRLSAMVSEIV